MFATIEKRFREVAPAADDWSLRVMHKRSETVSVRQDVPLPHHASDDLGVMVTVAKGGGVGYGATSDLTQAGLRHAARQATRWAERTASARVADLTAPVGFTGQGEYETPTTKPWDALSLEEKLTLLRGESARLKADPRIVDWGAKLWYTETDTLLCSARGGRIEQRFRHLVPTLLAVANEGVVTEQRSLGDRCARQGGLEVLDATGFFEAAPRLCEEALELLAAPHCPTGTMGLLLAPDQMILQIHESIGHPLELDRILGDERNYAGTSFVTPDMFRTYRYGSPLLNVTFDPGRSDQLASYGFDDHGTTAERAFIIKEGILLRGLGGALSQQRTGLEGCASARATSWNRPPIDRMANLNVEPGTSSLDELVAATGNGVYMETNCSWSIDDSRNKFQFGCERGRLIQDGALGPVVRKPNYRGISATFWRSLAGVGHDSTMEVMGTPYCGKGEPNQLIRVGHASPPCLFENVEVFGGRLIMQDYFNVLAGEVQKLLKGDEVYTLSFEGERSDFVRFNRSAVRQAGSVTDRSVSLDLIQSGAHAAADLTVAGDLELDLPRLKRLVDDLRGRRRFVDADPYLLYAESDASTERIREGSPPDPGEAIAAVTEAGRDRDLVGIYAAGDICRGFASSFGQRSWYQTSSFNLDWSFYHTADKAVKTTYAGFAWDPEALQKKVAWSGEQLAALRHEPTSVKPGRYRVYFAPKALWGLVGMLAWGGFGLKSHRTKQTPLLQMVEGDARMSSAMTIAENTVEGVAPDFQNAGFSKPDRVPLIEGGSYADCLVSPRSAREYGVEQNGASTGEQPDSLDIAAGALAEDAVLKELGTGIYIGNVWYLNFSDRTACRTTGMTRFATFFVEDGKISAPLNVMRFDETLYRALGENLIGLTAERELMLSAGTYSGRSTASCRAPGALVDDFTFTL